MPPTLAGQGLSYTLSKREKGIKRKKQGGKKREKIGRLREDTYYALYRTHGIQRSIKESPPTTPPRHLATSAGGQPAKLTV